MKLLLPALVVLVSLLTAPATAQDFDKGNAAYIRGDYAAALRELRTLAEQGHAKAQNYLGKMYDKGYGVPQHYAEALKWYRLAAKQGNANAQYNLGNVYGLGHGVPKDYVQAHMWLNLAAAQGFRRAFVYRERVAEKMTPADLSKAQNMAREWLEAHPQ